MTAADEDNKVKVKASFTDNAGYAEGPLTSSAYPSGGTIEPERDPELSFVDNGITIGEGIGAATLTVELDEASTGTVTVDYATSDSTAKAGDDYTATSGTLTFTSGQTSKTITIPIVNDTAYEPAERCAEQRLRRNTPHIPRGNCAHYRQRGGANGIAGGRHRR